MTGKRQRRLRRLVNRAARAWSVKDRRDGYSTAPAAVYRVHLRARVAEGFGRSVERWAVADS